MQIFKRAMALALTLVMVFSIIPAGAFALESTTVPKVDENSVTIEGTNGFGNLLSAAISEEQKAAAEAEPEYAAGYGVTGLEIEGNVATVTYNALEDAILIVALYSEDGMQMLASGKTAVTPDDTETTVTIEGTMPQYFQASAYLVDSYDFSPLCQAYETPVYTKEMQQLIASNIHDYDAELVLNLDEDENTNFAVYAEHVIRVQEVAGKNIVTTCDDENMRYVIENADETFTSLRPGDVVSYAYGENELLLVKVAAITVTGTTVTITGDNGIELEDAFDYLKLEITADNSDLEEIDNADAAKHSVGAVVPMGDENTDVEVKPIRYEFAGEEKKYFDGYVEVLLNNTMDFYHTLGNTHYEWELSYSITSNFKVEVNNEDDDKQWVIPILKDMRLVNIASFGLTFSPEFVFKASGSFTVNTTFYGSVGISCATGRKPMNISTPMKLTDNLALEGELFVGFDLSPRFYVLHEKVFYIEMGIPVGITASGEISWETENVFEGLAPEIHECTNCIEGEVYLSVSIDVSIKFFNKKNIELGGKITKKFASKPFYWSFDYGEFDWCYCPHKQYLVTVATVDLDGNPVPGVELTLGEMGKTTDESGIAQVYLPAGRNDVTVTYNGQTDSWVLTVKSEPAKMKIILGDQGNGFIFEEENLGSAVDYGEVIASGTCGADGDNLTWELTAGGLLTISGTGAMAGYLKAPWYSYRDTVCRIMIENGVTSIGQRAFERCSQATSVTIPDSVTSIGYAAFSGCAKLGDVELPEGITRISGHTFSGCSSLTEMVIPDTVTDIGEYAFQNCSNLARVEIPEGVKTIDQYVFGNCYDLDGVILPDSLTSLQQGAFYYCTSLTSIIIPEGVTAIKHDMFAGCNKLTSVTIPDSVTTIEKFAFCDCVALESLVLPETITDIKHNAFDGCVSLTEMDLPDSLTYIATDLFAGCTRLANVSIPDGVTTIGEGPFRGCVALKNLDLPESLTYIDSGAFSGCTGLTSITIPASLTEMNYNAFYQCVNLREIIFEGNAPVFSGHPFTGVTANVYYPAGNSTWTSAVMQNYGGTLTWIPYTLDENGDMIINEAAAVTVEAEQLDVPAEKMAVVQTGLDVPSQDFDEKDETVDPDAVYGGEYGTEVTDTYTLKTASFTGLVPGAEYLLLAMKRIDVDDPLTADNLLFIDQAQALENGALLFTYVQREDTGLSYVVACGASNKNLKDAVITFPEMVADGELQVVEPTVVYDGKTLTEGKDYTITGTASFTEAGTYTCHIRGIHNYSGTVECSYTVKSNVTATAKIISYSTSLGGNIAMNFYVELSEDLVTDPNAYIQFSFAGKTVNVPLSEGVLSGTSYRFACPITSKNMTDDITAQVYNGSGPVGDPKTMAVDTYCNWIIANTSDKKTINLMKAMLNYGASAQMLFSYRTDDLANAALADADKVFDKVDASAFAHSRVGEEDGIKPVSYTLLLDSETTVRCYFQLTGTKTIDEFTFTVDGIEVTPTYKDGYYYIEKANIAAHRLDDMHVFTCGNITITYGGMSYVNQVMTYYTSGTTFDMASALYAYSKAAEAYIG